MESDRQKKFPPKDKPSKKKALRYRLLKTERRIELYNRLVPWPALISSLEEDARKLRAILDRV